MDDMIKQRLVGALVLVALIVIFVPMIFDEEQAKQAELVELPPRPVIPQLDLERPVPPSEQATTETEEIAEPSAGVEPQDNEPIENAATESEVQSSAKQQTVEQAKELSLPQGWTLQLASFQEPANAEALRDKLRDAGFKAYIQQRPGSQPQMLRVMIGPELKRDAIEKIKVKVLKDFKIEGLVVQFEP